jgi:hypothetical protein
MRITRRRAVGALALVAAAVCGLVFGGGQVGMCLGPLGVTQIQCAKATGIVPTVGPGLPLCTFAAALAVVLIAPIPTSRLRPGVAVGALAAGVAAIVFAATWESTWTGLDSAGRMLAIERPLDLAALATAAIVGFVVGLMGWAHVIAPRLERRRSPQR